MTTTKLLATVRRMEVRTNRLVNDTMVGTYLSQFRGMDFEELRTCRRPFNFLEFDGIRNQLNGHHE